jgi:hypothetical protein
MTDLSKRFSAVLLMLMCIAALTLSGCEKEQGPLEEVGEALDESVKDTQRAVEDATD